MFVIRTKEKYWSFLMVAASSCLEHNLAQFNPEQQLLPSSKKVSGYV